MRYPGYRIDSGEVLRMTGGRAIAGAGTGTAPKKRVASDESGSTTQPWSVLLFNDDVHTFEEVIRQVAKATGCSRSEAEAHAWRAHLKGKTKVFDGDFESCLRVQGVLREIALVTEIRG